MEAFPPLVREDGSGLFVEVLKRIETVTDLSFSFGVMTLARAKVEVEKGRAEVLMLTAGPDEAPEFHRQFVSLDWGVPVVVDIYYKTDTALEKLERAKAGEETDILIGVLIGNTKVAAKLLELDPTFDFFEVTTERQLILLVDLGRIDLAIWPRQPIFFMARSLGVSGIKYQKIADIKGFMSFKNSPDGIRLRDTIDAAIRQIDITDIFHNYETLLHLPDSGTVPSSSAN